MTLKKKLRLIINRFKKDANFKIHPNIYHIMLDTYPSNKTLKEVYKIDNSNFYKELRKRKFKVYQNAYSNGARTHTSMQAVFEMKFFNPNHDEFILFGKNPAWGTLFAGGYTVACTYHCQNISDRLKKFSPIAQGITLDIRFFIQSYLSFYLSRWIIPEPRDTPAILQVMNYFKSKKIMKNIKPALFYITDGTYPFQKETLAPLNIIILGILDDIIENDSSSIIILHSDHGNRVGRPNQLKADYVDTPSENFGILQAVKFPKECERFNQIEMLSPVNYYQYIHSCLRGEEKPRHLEPANSYMKGLTIKTIWVDYDTKPFYLFIEDGKILDKPVKIEK